MDGKALLTYLDQARTARVGVYLNQKRVDELFLQRIGTINQIITSGELGGGFHLGLANILGVEVSRSQGLSAGHEISTLFKVLVLESFELEGGRLQPAAGETIGRSDLITHSGESRFVADMDRVTAETTGFPEALAQFVQQRRERQGRGSKMGTVVWTATVPRYLASIAYMESVVDIGHIYSYPEDVYGILGRKEADQQGVRFISPLWIWFEAGD